MTPWTVSKFSRPKYWSGYPFPFPGNLPNPGIKPRSTHIAGGFFTSWATREAQEYLSGKLIPSPVDLPNSGVKPGSPALQADSLPSELPGNPWVKSLSHVQLFATLWTVAHQAPPSMEFSRQEYWSGVPLPSPGDLPDPGIEPFALQGLRHCRQTLYCLSYQGSPFYLTVWLYLWMKQK